MTASLGDLLRLDIVKKPFPVAVDGDVVSGGDPGECSICLSCSIERWCLQGRRGESVCSLGVRSITRDVGGALVTVLGLAPTDLQGRRKPALRGRAVPTHIAEKWFGDLEGLLIAVESANRHARTDALDSIHDLSRMATEVANLSEDLVRTALKPGAPVETAPARHLAIHKAAELLTKEFERLELLVNPASAAVGKIYTQVYQLFHKYALILDLAFCKGRNRRIIMKGRSDMTIRTYESISVLAFALIENAAKYVCSGEVVEVEVNDGAGFVDISVSSVGPLIEEAEIQLIFDKKFRGRWARKSGVEGKGLGLHLAKIVADAHNTPISVVSSPLGYERDDIPVARNEFRMRLRSL